MLAGTLAPPSFVTRRRWRLATGLVLFAYVATHLLNHALGNVSLPVMEAGLDAQRWVWQGPVGTLALYGALAIHLALGLWAFYQRRHFGWTPAEIAQLILGLSVPPLLANHIVGTRIALAAFGVEKTYAQEFYSFWVAAPWLGVQQVSVLLIAWIHGCIGLHASLRLRPRMAAWMPALLAVAVLLPALALLGFFQGGRTVVELATHADWRAAALAPGHVGTHAQVAALRSAWIVVELTGAGLVAAVIAARGVRALWERRSSGIRVRYPDGRVVRAPRGFSVLEASRSARIPHSSVCGGRARCSTCRVRVLAGDTPAIEPGEQAVLDRIAAEPGVRLACQLRPRNDVTVAPLVPPASLAGPRPLVPRRLGEERVIVAMAVDMRDSMQLAGRKLPYDVVFIVDRFVTAIGAAIEQAGGRANHFTGDGLMAVFGLACDPAQAAMQALDALVRIDRDVATLNTLLAAEMGERIRFGVGIHASRAIVGEIGYGDSLALTTVGDASNTAARLEAECKALGCLAVISEPVCRLSGIDFSGLPLRLLELRGREKPVQARLVADIAALSHRQQPVGAADHDAP